MSTDVLTAARYSLGEPAPLAGQVLLVAKVQKNGALPAVPAYRGFKVSKPA